MLETGVLIASEEYMLANEYSLMLAYNWTLKKMEERVGDLPAKVN